MVMAWGDVALCWVRAESNCLRLHTCEKKNYFSPSSQEDCFVFFYSFEEKELFKVFDPQFEHIIGLRLHSVH